VETAASFLNNKTTQATRPITAIIIMSAFFKIPPDKVSSDIQSYKKRWGHFVATTELHGVSLSDNQRQEDQVYACVVFSDNG
jgi:hypothetical protein